MIKDSLNLAREGLRLGLKGLRKGRSSWPKPEGDLTERCRAIARGNWNGTWFGAGLDHLDQFWLRDFALCLPGLLDLGFEKEAEACWRWALSIYQRKNRITTTIFPGERPIDIFSYGADTFPLALHIFEVLRLDPKPWGELLRAEASRYREELFDAAGDVCAERMYSITKDTTHFPGSTAIYAMACWARRLVARCPEIDEFRGLADIEARLVEIFWNGEAFRNDRHNEANFISADANHWPFWCKLLPESEHQKMLTKSVAAIRGAGLTKPFPLKYHSQRYPSREHPIQRLFVPNYQGDSIWTFFTPDWIAQAASVDPAGALEDVQKTEEWLERFGTWIEVFEPDGSGPLKGRFGHGSDWGMLWAANWPRCRRAVIEAQNN